MFAFVHRVKLQNVSITFAIYNFELIHHLYEILNKIFTIYSLEYSYYGIKNGGM